jgi:hypothetical protein
MFLYGDSMKEYVVRFVDGSEMIVKAAAETVAKQIAIRTRIERGQTVEMQCCYFSRHLPANVR